MDFKNLVEEIKTIRDFKDKHVDNGLIQEVIKVAEGTKGIVENANTSILFIEDGEELYNKLSDKVGYYGNMIKAPHYIAVLSQEFPHYVENSGYIMESMRLKAWTLGLGSCWLHIEEPEAVKKTLQIDTKKIVIALIAIGYPYTGIFKSDTSVKPIRKGITDLVYAYKWGETCSMEHLYSRGLSDIFYYAKAAPSWGNKQPWRFIVTTEKILLTVSKALPESMYLDAGIMMLYFEKASQEEGIMGKWKFEIERNVKRKYDIPEEYEPIAYYII